MFRYVKDVTYFAENHLVFYYKYQGKLRLVAHEPYGTRGAGF